MENGFRTTVPADLTDTRYVLRDRTAGRSFANAKAFRGLCACCSEDIRTA
jgi:hypothetical protein